MAKAHIVHGFNVDDAGMSTTDVLMLPLATLGYEPVQHDYGWQGPIGTLLFNRSIAEGIVPHVSKGDIGVGHSNGCAILSRVVEKGAQLDGLVFINPALDNDWTPPEHVKWVRVYHSTNDKAVQIAKYIPFVRWGDMGRVGYTGKDTRVQNIDISPYTHSEFFKHIDVWGATLAPSIRVHSRYSGGKRQRRGGK